MLDQGTPRQGAGHSGEYVARLRQTAFDDRLRAGDLRKQAEDVSSLGLRPDLAAAYAAHLRQLAEGLEAGADLDEHVASIIEARI